jgi:hypothetical protein
MKRGAEHAMKNHGIERRRYHSSRRKGKRINSLFLNFDLFLM